MNQSEAARPELTPNLSAAEFLRWYWLRTELAYFARQLGIPTSGGKELLTQRIAAHLDGASFAEPVATMRSNQPQLSGTLTLETVIPTGQRCSQILRTFFANQIDTSFHFDGEMREFFALTDGTQTLADAVAHWQKTRNRQLKSIGSQFEYNRFTRAWHIGHPDGSRSELLAAWRKYRSLPIDGRGQA